MQVGDRVAVGDGGQLDRAEVLAVVLVVGGDGAGRRRHVLDVSRAGVDDQQRLRHQRAAAVHAEVAAEGGQVQVPERRVVARAVAVRGHPDVFAGVQVDGGHALVGRLDEREAARPGHRRRPRIGEVADRRGGRPGDQLHRPQPRLRRDEEPAGLRVDGGAGPVDAPAGAGRLDDRFRRAPHRRRGEDGSELGAVGEPDRLRPQLRREVDQVVDGDPLQIERRRLRREGLRGGVPLARHVPPRDRPLLDRPDRLARDPVEHVGERLLARLRDRPDLAAVDGDVEQVAGGGEVVVPQPVVDRLEVPDPLAGLGVDADDAFGEEVVAGAHAAVPVVGRGAGRQIDVAELLVDRHRAPDVRVAAVAPRFVVPGVGAELPALGDGVEDPLHFAGAGVEAAHVAGVGLAAGERRVLDDAADDHGVAGDRQRLRVGEPGAVDGAAQRRAQVDGAVRSEVRVLPAGAGVQRHQQQVVRGDEDAGVVAPAVLPVGDATMLPPHVGGPVEPVVGPRVVRPDELAGARVERRHLSERRAQVDQPADHQRHRLERAGTDLFPLAGDLGLDRRPAPRDLQIGEVLRRDLRERGVFGVRRVVAEVAPLGVGRRLRGGGPRAGRRQRGDRERGAGQTVSEPSAAGHRCPPVVQGRSGRFRPRAPRSETTRSRAASRNRPRAAVLSGPGARALRSYDAALGDVAAPSPGAPLARERGPAQPGEAWKRTLRPRGPRAGRDRRRKRS